MSMMNSFVERTTLRTKVRFHISPTTIPKVLTLSNRSAFLTCTRRLSSQTKPSPTEARHAPHRAVQRPLQRRLLRARPPLPRVQGRGASPLSFVIPTATTNTSAHSSRPTARPPPSPQDRHTTTTPPRTSRATAARQRTAGTTRDMGGAPRARRPGTASRGASPRRTSTPALSLSLALGPIGGARVRIRPTRDWGGVRARARAWRATRRARRRGWG